MVMGMLAIAWAGILPTCLSKAKFFVILAKALKRNFIVPG
jgi:hypothetical protein